MQGLIGGSSSDDEYNENNSTFLTVRSRLKYAKMLRRDDQNDVAHWKH
jgi:hypothetical protein